MNFKSWQYYKENAEELNLYTKAYLKELGLKPKNDTTYEYHKVYTGGHWKEFKFYKIEDSEPIKTKQKPIIRDLETTGENLCKSLYVINKSAKKSRDTKQDNYYKRNFGIVNRAKTRQNDLYELKNDVVSKMIEEELLTLKGYHIQNLEEKSYLLLYTFNDTYSFHILVEEFEIDEDMTFLGELKGKISAEVKIKTDIKFNEAVNLLVKYIDQD